MQDYSAHIESSSQDPICSTTVSNASSQTISNCLADKTNANVRTPKKEKQCVTPPQLFRLFTFMEEGGDPMKTERSYRPSLASVCPKRRKNRKQNSLTTLIGKRKSFTHSLLIANQYKSAREAVNKSDKESGHKMKNMALKRTLTPKNTEGTLCSHKKAQNKITIAAAQKEKANININKTEKNRYKADEVAQLFRKKKQLEKQLLYNNKSLFWKTKKGCKGKQGCDPQFQKIKQLSHRD